MMLIYYVLFNVYTPYTHILNSSKQYYMYMNIASYTIILLLYFDYLKKNPIYFSDKKYELIKYMMA